MATKLQPDDAVVTVALIHDNQNVVLQTKEGYFLRFAAEEVSEKEKGRHWRTGDPAEEKGEAGARLSL